MSLFAEAMRSAFLPCSFAILVPALVVVVIGGTRTRVAMLGIYLGAASLFAWFPFLRFATPLDHNVGGAMTLGVGVWR